MNHRHNTNSRSSSAATSQRLHNQQQQQQQQQHQYQHRLESSLGRFLVRTIMLLLSMTAIVNFVCNNNLPTPISHEILRQQFVAVDRLVGKALFRKEPPPPSPYVVRHRERWLWNMEENDNHPKHGQQQVEKKDKQGHALHHNIHSVHIEDLKGVADTSSSSSTATTTTSKLSIEQASIGREPLLAILKDAGVTEIDAESIAALPTWEQVEQLYGQGPVVYGLETCEEFRQSIPVDDASIGTAGLFNTGTNPFAMYLEANCVMPHNVNDKHGGMRWQVPWGKHMLASRKDSNTAKRNERVNKTNVLPVALIREPYTWMQSMCRHPYAAKWVHNEHHCPVLVPAEHDFEHHGAELVETESEDNPGQNRSSVPVTIGYPHKAAKFESMAHLWSQWYNEYMDADYPRLIVRFEDLIFHPKELLSIVCECAGAQPKQDVFSYVVGEGKWGSKVHEGSSNLISAMIRYGKDVDNNNGSNVVPPEIRRTASLTVEDLEFAREHLDPNLMHIFQYTHPNPSEGEISALKRFSYWLFEAQ